MRICIYKTDEAPDLTLLLREGLLMPGDTEKKNWTQIKIVTQGELRGDLLTKMERTGHCVVRLGRVSLQDREVPSAAPLSKKIGSYRWRGFPYFFRRMASSLNPRARKPGRIIH